MGEPATGGARSLPGASVPTRNIEGSAGAETKPTLRLYGCRNGDSEAFIYTIVSTNEYD